MKTLLLLGDSLIEYGDWATLMPGYRTFNRGAAGESVGELAGRLAREVDLDEDPDGIILMSGTNNMLMGDESFPAVFETMLPRLGQLCPATRIVVIGLPPVTLPWITRERLEAVNALFSDIVERNGCDFLDIGPVFDLYCRPVGNPCFIVDGVHFSPHGYRVLADAIISILN